MHIHARGENLPPEAGTAGRRRECGPRSGAQRRQRDCPTPESQAAGRDNSGHTPARGSTHAGLSTLTMLRLVFWGPRPRINQGVTVMGTLLRVQRAEVLVSPCPAAGAASGESRRPSGPHSPHLSHEPLRLKRVSAAPFIP